MESKKINLKKILVIVGDVLFAVAFCFIILFAIMNLNAKANNNIPNLFGKGYVVVLSDSMKTPDGEEEKDDQFEKGDLVVIDLKKASSKDLKTGQIVTYYDEVEKKIISHRIIEVTKTDSNLVYYTLIGDNYNKQVSIDTQTTVIEAGEVMGVYIKDIDNLGSALSWCSSSVGFFTIVVVPTLIFLVFEIVSFSRALIEYKNEKNGIVRGANAAIDVEALKKQLLEEIRQEQANKEKEETSPKSE